MTGPLERSDSDRWTDDDDDDDSDDELMRDTSRSGLLLFWRKLDDRKIRPALG